MTDYKLIIISVTFLLISIVSTEANESLCNKTVTETKYRDEIEEYTTLEMVDVKCKRTFSNLFKKKNCPELRNVTKERTIQVPYEVTKVVKICCSGYERKGRICVPVCQRVCENAKCTGPDTCTCKEGYKHFSPYRCVPACENCVHGHCIAPGVCDCYRGYQQIDGVCQPICDPPCKTGVCTEPNVCDSNIEASSTTEKQADIEYSGEITPPHSYEDHSEDYDDHSEANSATFDDYSDEIIKETPLISSEMPKIEATTPKIQFSSPSNPCPEGLALDSHGECRLQCEIDCQFGTHDDGKCLCNEGFRNSPVNPCVCEPHCDHECYNGLCTGNNTCLCDEGYNLNPEDKFTCLDSNTCHCINGDCEDEDNCDCWSGYKLEYSERNYHRCAPLCGDTKNPEGCVNGDCIAPFLCQCKEGFIKGPVNNFTCYADMECGECISKGLNCLPACYTTTTTSTTTTTTTEASTTEHDWITSSDYEDENYRWMDRINSTWNETNYEYEEEPYPIYNNNLLTLYSSMLIGFLLIIIGIALLLRRLNKPVDYDVNQREHSENNVYFIKRQDDIKLEI
ncbi:tenascin-like [Culicoides brevitarsis]|uniref:tenascin-like n=1 Tax=Culicoides brevitarsis TaxID=469753 RepID=UPI00307C8402